MAGIPPFNGFLSKESFIDAMLSVTHANIFSLNTLGMIFPIMAIAGSIFTFVYAIKFVMHIFWQTSSRSFAKTTHEAPILMLVSPTILAILVIALGLFPGWTSQALVAPAAASNQSVIKCSSRI